MWANTHVFALFVQRRNNLWRRYMHISGSKCVGRIPFSCTGFEAKRMDISLAIIKEMYSLISFL